MQRNLWLAIGLLTAACAREPEASSGRPAATIGLEAHPGVRDLYALAEAQRQEHELPALALGMIRDGRIVGLGVAGETRAGSREWATLAHRFEIASCAKSFTATVAARLVEQGVISWATTLQESFPDLRATMAPEFREVTLEWLLRHRSGLGQTMNHDARWLGWHRAHPGASATEQRRLLVAQVLSEAPRTKPDTEEYYTNDAYLVAAAMMEKATQKPWEESVRELVFAPLGLATMHFGAPDAASGVPVMWGHNDGSFGRTRAIAPQAADYGTPPFGSPGGFLYCTLTDLLRWVDCHLAGANGRGAVLSRESFARLHTPRRDGGFGLGWEVEVMRAADGRVLERSIYHGGNSAGFRANMWFCPESRTGTVILYNHAGDERTDDYVPIFYALLREFGLSAP